MAVSRATMASTPHKRGLSRGRSRRNRNQQSKTQQHGLTQQLRKGHIPIYNSPSRNHPSTKSSLKQCDSGHCICAAIRLCKKLDTRIRGEKKRSELLTMSKISQEKLPNLNNTLFIYIREFSLLCCSV